MSFLLQDAAIAPAAKEILENEIKPNFPEVEIEYIEMMSNQGQKMVQEYDIMSSPGIIVNGELFSVDGLDKNKLVEKMKCSTTGVRERQKELPVD